MPKQDVFFTLFNGMGDDVRRISDLFAELAQNFKNLDTYAKRACAIEKDGDTKTHQIIEELNVSFITPFDREDVYCLAHKLDDVVDLTEDVIRDIHLYALHEPVAPMKEFSKLYVHNARLITEMLSALPRMKITPELRAVKIKIHDNEDRGDALFADAIKKLFKEEKDPIEIIKRKDVIEGMEMISDKYQDVSNIIESIIIKHG
jgi:uncharacterized protein